MDSQNGYYCGWINSSVWDACRKLTDWFCSADLLVSCVDSFRPPAEDCKLTSRRLRKLVPDLALVENCYLIRRQQVRKVILEDLLFTGFCEVVLIPSGAVDDLHAPPVEFTTDEIKFSQSVPPSLLDYLNGMEALGCLGDGIGLGMNFAVRNPRVAGALSLPGD